MANNTGRIKKEIEAVRKDTKAGVTVEEDPNDPRHFFGVPILYYINTAHTT